MTSIRYCGSFVMECHKVRGNALDLGELFIEDLSLFLCHAGIVKIYFIGLQWRIYSSLVCISGF